MDHAERGGMLSTGNLTALFHEMVRTAMAAQQVASSETTEFYLVQLLEGFARPARGNLLDPPLALHYLEAFHLPAAKSYEKLKRVADTALFITGVFVDSLERSLVGPEYYTALGRNAYARLSAETAPPPPRTAVSGHAPVTRVRPASGGRTRAAPSAPPARPWRCAPPRW